MQNFIQYSPTEIVFGKDTQHQVGAQVKKWGGSKTLIVYGQGSVVRSGLLDQVKASLEKEGVSYCEWSGVQPNPRLAHAQVGCELAVREGVDFILGVGGGSVIDTAKAIAHGVANPQNPIWDIWTGKAKLTKTTPVGVVLTISAAGSETSDSAVLTNEEVGKKAGINTDLNRPVFAIMNPELTYTLPKFQIACGVVDIMMHTLERYFIPNSRNRMTDEIAQGLLRTVIDSGRVAMKNPSDYDAMSEIMWCGSLSHNNLTGLGRAKDFSVHKMGHALGARFDKAHGATLSAIWEAWALYGYQNDLERFKHYGKTVWGIETEEPEAAAREAIACTVEYFRELNMPTCLSELGVGIQEEKVLRELAMDATMKDTVVLSHLRKLRAEDVYQIYVKANH